FLLTVTALCLAGWGAGHALLSRSGPVARGAEGSAGPDGKDVSPAGPGRDSPDDPLASRFSSHVQPFLQRFCFSCHGPKKREGSLDLSRDAGVTAVSDNTRRWGRVLERLTAHEMPPDDAPRQPGADERAAVVAWIR